MDKQKIDNGIQFLVKMSNVKSGKKVLSLSQNLHYLISIVHLKFYKICKFENHVTRNDVIMKSLPKTMENNGKMRTSAEPTKIYIVRKVLIFQQFIEFEPLC